VGELFRSELKISRWSEYGVIKISYKFSFMSFETNLPARQVTKLNGNHEGSVLVRLLLINCASGVLKDMCGL
jgi:hypothetical protein